MTAVRLLLRASPLHVTHYTARCTGIALDRAAKAMLQRIAYEAVESFKQGDRVRKEGYKKSFRTALYDFLDDQQQEQRFPVLFEPKTIKSDAVVDPGSADVVRWLIEQGGDRSYFLGEMLLARNLYKRVLVISRSFSSNLDWARRRPRFLSRR